MSVSMLHVSNKSLNPCWNKQIIISSSCNIGIIIVRTLYKNGKDFPAYLA